ncbi:DHA2 family efflux MFS transporter permease subunit [Levilactobacillus fujinensis]|nr:DHA2 family efflux MFS transporter permease subunit [Levilactobacillus fujinensis]
MTETPNASATRFSVFGSAGLAFCGVLVETSMNVTFPTLMTQFHTSLNAVQWVTTAYLLAVAATMVITAFIQSRFRLKAIISVGGTAFVVGGMLCALAPSLPILLLGRVIQAVGTGFAMPLVFALIMHQVPFAQQGRYTGTAGMLIALAPSLGPTYGGLMTQLLSWRLIFWLTLPIGLISWLVAVTHLQQTWDTEHRSFPWGQFILIVAALGLTTLAFNNAGNDGFGAPGFYGLFLLACVALAGFIWLANRGEQPLLQLKIFRHTTFSKVLFLYFLIQFTQIGLTFLLPNFTQLVLGKNAMVSGLMLLAGSLTSAILSPVAGRLMDHRGVTLPLRLGASCLLLTAILFMLVANRLSVPLIIGLFVLFQFGFSFMFNNLLTFGLQQLPRPQIGDGNAAFNTLQQYSGSLGTAIMAASLALGAKFQPAANAINQTRFGTVLALSLTLAVMIVVFIVTFTIRQPAKAK